MVKKKSRHDNPKLGDDDLPSWVKDDSAPRSTPYTEEELDLLVEGTIEGIRDTAAWMNLGERVGEEEARRELRSRLIMLDENALQLTRH